MATLVLGAVGGAVGGAIGGSILGVSGAALGRAAGAVVGRRIDGALLGGGSEPVSVGQVDRFRLNGASEGAPLPRVHGRMRVAGHVIWASPFQEHRSRSGGGKGRPMVVSHRYSVSLALALCEGEVRRIGRVWADGRLLALDEVPIRLHPGTEDQLPDALIEAEMGEGAPAYRGTAYVILEDLDLGPFGNRVPQFSFEVVRGVEIEGMVPPPQDLVQGVSLLPGSGEFALATSRVERGTGPDRRVANVNSAAEVPDLLASLRDLREEVPGLTAASLVVSWFGDDLRCGSCRIRPMVEAREVATAPWSWSVAGLSRAEAAVVPQIDGRPVYGGTPDDRSVVQAIRAIASGGQAVTYHPFILMTQMAGNGLPDPSGAAEQAAFPWRGRITSAADGTDAVRAEVAAFFGGAEADDFVVGSDAVRYRGPDEWGFRRFVLHQAALCAVAGGVEGFVIGSEMVGLTTLRDGGGAYPAVEQLRALAQEVRRLLPDAKIGYAADWTEWSGHRPDDGSGDVRFHLDPLWADPVIDFVGIDNYAPMSDWRDAPGHADASWGSGHSLDYLRSNIEGGEGFDWFYADDAARAAQARTPITDGAYGEPWVHRVKDVRSWWSHTHHDRPGGVRSTDPTAWRPGMKPIRFIEYGCAAVDKGAVQPNRFPDALSSEAGLPFGSNGARDDAMQMQYIRAMLSHWGTAPNNPVSPMYGGPMVELSRSFLWAWDARPWPAFPGSPEVWGDAGNHATGHWWTGRAGALPLATVIADICGRAGVEADVSAVRGAVRGLAADRVQSARADLEPLLAAYGVDAAQRGGALMFTMREDAHPVPLEADLFVREAGVPVREEVRAPDVEGADRVVVHHIDAEGRFELRTAESLGPYGATGPSVSSELPLSLTAQEGIALAARHRRDAILARETVAFALPPSRHDIGSGAVVEIDRMPGTWRIDRVVDGSARRMSASRVELAGGTLNGRSTPPDPTPAYRAAVGMDLTMLDLPGSEPGTVQVVAAGPSWPGDVAVLCGAGGTERRSLAVIDRPGIVGLTETVLPIAVPGVLDHGQPLLVRLASGSLGSVSDGALLAGANRAAIGMGDGEWEVLQFRDAVPMGGGLWALSARLRGRDGTDAAIRDPWPSGATVVVLNDAVTTLPGAVGVARHLRYGPARFPSDHDTWRSAVVTPRGVAERPYAPVHLRAVRDETADRVSWVRRSRHGLETWDRPVPLGEAFERYALRASVDGTTLWEGFAVAPRVVLDRAVLGLPEVYDLDVAQVSETWGPGFPRRITVS